MTDTNALIGTPFVFGGRDPMVGLDCWGLVAHVLRESGLPMPPGDWEPETLVEGHRLLTEQARSGDWVGADGSVGDVVAMFRGDVVVHVGICEPGGVLHTARGLGVVIQTRRALQKSFGYSAVKFYRWAGSL